MQYKKIFDKVNQLGFISPSWIICNPIKFNWKEPIPKGITLIKTLNKTKIGFDPSIKEDTVRIANDGFIYEVIL